MVRPHRVDQDEDDPRRTFGRRPRRRRGPWRDGGGFFLPAGAEGKKRAHITKYVDDGEFFLVEAEPIEDGGDKTTEVEALIRTVNSTFENYVKLNKKIPPEMIMSVASIEDPARLADTIVAHLGIKLEDKQSLLELLDPAERLEKVLGYMRSEIEILEVEKRIRTRVKKQMEKTQKEYYLNEQMRAIQKELGEKDEFKNEIQELEEKIKQKKMSAEAREKAEKELKKLKMMSPMSAEATVVRNYIDWIISLPWNDFTDDKLDINSATTCDIKGATVTVASSGAMKCEGATAMLG